MPMPYMFGKNISSMMRVSHDSARIDMHVVMSAGHSVRVCERGMRAAGRDVWVMKCVSVSEVWCLEMKHLLHTHTLTCTHARTPHTSG